MFCGWLKDNVNFPVCLAPMVGLSHVAFRMLLRDYLPANAKTLWPTEMLSPRWIRLDEIGKTPDTQRDQQENNLVPQILVNNHDKLGEFIAALENWGAEVIDVNMGCPAPRVQYKKMGVALMQDPDCGVQTVAMVVKNSHLPVSVKIRSGNQQTNQDLLGFVRRLLDVGVAWICLHPRNPDQKRRGQADWEQVRSLKSELPCPIIGNGDIQTAADVLWRLETTQCDMIMIGRALTARPWLFWQVGEILGFQPPLAYATASAPQTGIEEGAEYGKALQKFCSYLEYYFSADYALRRLVFFIKTGSPWLEWGHTLYSAISAATTMDEAKCIIAEFFAKPQRMQQKTSLLI